MALRVYNTLTGRKEEFVPLKPGEVGMYVCGVTVYDLCHIGHARSMIVFDVIYRWLKASGYKVTYVRNFTDLDDKIIERAKREGVSFREIASRYIAEFYTDMDALGLERPQVEPKATEHLREMIEMVKVLLSKGFAYEVDGDVYFSVESFPGYGRLSGRNLEEMMAGARIEPDPRKRNPLDFALWKASKPGEPAWESPWGKGRPGWHLECSVMSQKYLGESFDIHGGGQDLIFPHHENEIAQSEAATGRPFVRYWLHNGFVNIRGEKMSKSLGNVLTIRQLTSSHHPEVLRLFLLGRHYRSPIDYSEEALKEASRGLERLYGLYLLAEESLEGDSPSLAERWNPVLERIKDFPSRFQEAMDDDFNTPQALSLLFELAREINRLKGKEPRVPREVAEGVKEAILKVSEVLGLLSEEPREFFEASKRRRLQGVPLSEEEIERLIASRTEARRRKDWEKADQIRDYLASFGIILEDTPQGTIWRIR
ncbi:MAG: cysteine--tRNA ligase [Deltaproteobacteria bacterium]|nr:MAG: cysteine--tRNA ligase [Deltaproteobacteria bacterium]